MKKVTVACAALCSVLISPTAFSGSAAASQGFNFTIAALTGSGDAGRMSGALTFRPTGKSFVSEFTLRDLKADGYGICAYFQVKIQGDDGLPPFTRTACNRNGAGSAKEFYDFEVERQRNIANVIAVVCLDDGENAITCDRSRTMVNPNS